MKRLLPAVLPAILIGVLASAALPAQAWGPTGHMIVAQIAYQELRPEVRAEADRLIALMAEDSPVADHFVPASYWMDRLRQSGWRAFDHWHYTNRPINGDGLGDVPPEDRHNVAWAIHQARATLASPQAGDRQKAWMLRVLIHTVGDVHQPLHCVARFTRDLPKGDRGGNLFLLAGGSNLHGYWDGLAGRFSNVSPDGNWRPQVQALSQEVLEEVPPEVLAAKTLELDPEIWVRESFALALSAVYDGVEAGALPTSAYQARAQRQAVLRLALAGVRLGALLNEVLGD